MFDRAQLPPLARLAPHGLRVSISASEEKLAFVADFKPLPDGCVLLDGGAYTDVQSMCRRVAVDYFLLDTDPYGRAPSTVRSTYRFEVPEERFRDANIAFNFLAERWPGEPSPDLGGTWVEAEQFVDAKQRSASSNSNSPLAPTAVLLKHVHSLLLSYAPTGTVPRSGDFAAGELDLRSPCLGLGMNTPDADGFAVGADACARRRTQDKAGAHQRGGS